MKVLYAGFERYPFHSEESFEHVNIYLSLLQLSNVEVDYYRLDRAPDLRTASYEIKERVLRTRPEALLLFMNHDLDKAAFREMRTESNTKTIAILSDEDTDLYLRSLTWGGVFDWFWTFYPPAFEEYHRRGVKVIGSNWASNPDFFKPGENLLRSVDVSFVGARKPERQDFIAQLERKRIHVECFGSGWPRGAVSYDRMRQVFCSSKISLNLGFAKSIWRWQTLLRVFLSPRKGGGVIFDPWHARRNVKTILMRRRPQSRARPFEIAACRTFTLTNRTPFFGKPYEEDAEMVFYTDVRDAAEKIKYYLENAERREKIAEAGYRKTITEHSFVKRLSGVFSAISANESSVVI